MFEHTFEGLEMVKKAVAEGRVLEMRQYRSFGHRSPWRPVTAERALHKASVVVTAVYGDYEEEGIFHPYEFRVVG